MMFGIWWLWWALGTFGVTGTGLLIWLAPAAIPQILAALLKFFTTPLGAAIGAAAIAFFVADVNRSLRDQHEFAARTAAFAQEQKARDKRIEQETREEVWIEIANQTAANAATDKEVKEFTHALPQVPYASGNPFRVGADACRLRHIVGQAECGSGGAKGVPAPRSENGGAVHRRGFRLPRIVGRGAG